MTNTNDARRRDPLEAGATSRVTPPVGRHAAHAGSNVAQSAGATSANRTVSPQATGALPAMNKPVPATLVAVTMLRPAGHSFRLVCRRRFLLFRFA